MLAAAKNYELLYSCPRSQRKHKHSSHAESREGPNRAGGAFWKPLIRGGPAGNKVKQSLPARRCPITSAKRCYGLKGSNNETVVLFCVRRLLNSLYQRMRSAYMGAKLFGSRPDIPPDHRSPACQKIGT